MSDLFADLRHAFRGFRRQPLFAAIAVLSMALGIAVDTSVFTLVDQVVLRQLPVTRPGELVQVAAPGTESYGGGMGDGTELSYAMYRDLRDHNEVFTETAARFVTSLNVTFRGTSERVAGELVTGTFFPVLGTGDEIGRVLTPDDDAAPGRSPVAVLGYDYWRTRFAGDPSIVGKTLEVNGHALEVVGVAARRFAGLDFGAPAQVYVPLTMQPQMGPPGSISRGGVSGGCRSTDASAPGSPQKRPGRASSLCTTRSSSRRPRTPRSPTPRPRRRSDSWKGRSPSPRLRAGIPSCAGRSPSRSSS